MRQRSLKGGVITLAISCAFYPLTVIPAQAAQAASTSGVTCVAATHAYDALAKRMAADITARLRGRAGSAGLNLTDSQTGVTCWYHSKQHFYAASVMKVTILAALLRKTQEQHRKLTEAELRNAWLMITQSDNDAANYLWFDVGLTFMQHFLDLAGMTQTSLGPGPYWGLTQITARDEMRLLRLLVTKNTVFDTKSRDYALGLMARVIPSQRWGVTAGAPRGLTAHVKNGWLPLAAHGWRIHSIGCFTGHGGGYCIVVLTQDNPTMSYGVATIELIARAINRDLNR